MGAAPSLVLLLPHAHEGAGPDHASARPERFLQLAADINMRIANCTTAAQYFHLLRRQAALLLEDPLPLIVLTPKSLLRHPMVASTPRELAEGRFRMVIDDEEARARAEEIRRVVLCTRQDVRRPRRQRPRARRRTRSPLPARAALSRCRRELRATLDGYRAADDIVWVQEEPENMGTGTSSGRTSTEAAGGRPVRVIARPRSASPAEGLGGAPRRSQQQFARRSARSRPIAGGSRRRARSRAPRPKPEQVAGALEPAVEPNVRKHCRSRSR